MQAFAKALKAEARTLGFERVGVAPAVETDGFAQLAEWLERGYGGEMRYLAGDARCHPRSILPDVRSVVMLAYNYAPHPGAPSGSIARYARGADYHDVLRAKLNALLAWAQECRPGLRGRGVVDTAPLLERDFARRAGLGWIGKNTMLLHPKLGSWFFLAALLLDVDLPADAPFATQHCGTCTRCLDACPTDAFVAPGRLDARRCISYLTIELRGPIPEELRPGMGDWIFGCDVCQEVCPWNRKAPFASDASLAPPEWTPPDLADLLALDDAAFRRRFRGTPIFRAKRRGLLRNVAIALGNAGDRTALPALERAAVDVDPLVREAASWAIERLRATSPYERAPK